MLTIGQIVNNKKGQQGTIARIITKSTGYVEVNYNGTLKKEMAFNLTDENGNQLKATPKPRKAPELSPLQKTIQTLKWINGVNCGDRNSMSYQLCCENLYKIINVAKEQDNKFIISVCESVMRYYRISDKQAYYVALFVEKNNITL